MGAYEDQPSIIRKIADLAQKLSAIERTQDQIPAGTILATGRTSAPAGYLMCDGSVVDRTTYAGLFAAISTRFNVGGEAGTDFRLPAFNNENRYPRGASTPGGKSGAVTHDHTMAHTHGFSGSTGGPSSTMQAQTAGGLFNAGDAGHTHSFSGTTGGSSATNTGSASSLPPSQDAAYMIKT